MNQVCAQCGAVGFHQPGCALGQITAPLQQTAQSAAAIRGEVGAVHGDVQAGFGGLHRDVQSGFGAVQQRLAVGNVLAAASLGVQVQQLGVQVRQLGHLQSIDAAMARMAYHQERQAALTQVLFELQQKGAFVTDLARTDAFAAGIYGRLFVEQVNGAGISVEAFDKLEYKHEFATVMARLRAAWTPFALRPEAARKAEAFLVAAREAASWQGVQVPDDAQVDATFRRAAEVRAERDRLIPEMEERNQRADKLLVRLAVAFGAVLVIHLVLFVVCAMTFKNGVELLNSFFMLAEVGLLIAGAIIFAMKNNGPSSSGPHPDELERQAFAMKEVLGRYRAFASRPDGAQLVDEVLRAHPALRQQ